MSQPRTCGSFAALLSAMVAATALFLAPAPVRAARPLLDQPQWDRYFALSAPDVEVPWKAASVRLATYSGAPVDFAVYNIDPAEVIVAGRNRAARAIDTSGRAPLARWRFAPPRGYRFEVSQVDVPIGNQEGFYVVEARRGAATQQVWLNRTHIGLVTKESPDGLLLWAVDLRDGRVLRGMHVAFLVGQELDDERTDAHGTILWRTRPRPAFALADDGPARAFVSLLPQAPLPPVIVGLRLERSSVRAGQSVNFTGFVRRRVSNVYHRGTGDVRVALLGQGRTIETALAPLDAAGAFTGRLTVPSGVASSEYTVLASAAGGVAGNTLHVDTATEVTLALRSNCPCSTASDVGLTVIARGNQGPVADLPISVRVIRSPHIIPPGESEGRVRWGTTLVDDERVRTDAHGEARIELPPPSDGLASTYGVRAAADGATATTDVTVPTSSIALAIEPDVTQADVGEPLGFTVRGFDAADGTPKPGLRVRARLVHGPVAWSQDVTLDDRGRARLSFTTPSLGSNLAFAEATDAAHRRALDVTAVTVDPSNRHAGATNEESLTVTLDRARYQTGDEVHMTALTPGASGDALVTLEGARTYETRIAEIAGGKAESALSLPPMLGQARVGVAAVHDGAVELGSTPLVLDAPGRARALTLALGRSSFAPGERVRATLSGARFSGGATLTVRLADGRESDSAYFDDAPDVLSIGGTSTQNPASADPAWHTFVEPTHSNAADVYAAERPRTQRNEDLALGAAVPNVLFWQIERSGDGSFSVDMPAAPGIYVLSVLAVGDDGGVGGGFRIRERAMKLLLLDTYGLVYRAFFALPELTTSGGVPINAAYGFTQMLAKIIADTQPTHVVAAFDRGLPRERMERFPAYKAQRPEMPDALRSQFGLVRRILAAYAIPVVEMEGEEADDVIATLAVRAEAEGAPVEVVTGDLDLLQIVDERTTVLVTKRGITTLDRYDPAAVRARFELEPAQLPDYRGLKGDPSDNLPGVPGIGEKTAIKLIKSVGSLDALLADPDKAGSPRLANLLREHAESARACRDVSRACRDLALDFSWEDARFAAPSPETLIPLYRELEFKTLLARLTAAANGNGAGTQTMLLGDESPRVSGAYAPLADDQTDIERIVASLREAIGAEQVGLASLEERIGVTMAAGTGFSFSSRALEHASVREGLGALWSRSKPLLAHDAKSIAALARAHGLRRDAPFDDDVMILAYLLDPSRSYARLDDIVTEYLDERLPEGGAPERACAAADAVLRLAPLLRERLRERGQWSLYETLELPLVSVLASMEAAGIAVDRSELRALAREVDAAVIRLHHEIQELAGEPFNVASPQQIGAVLFDRLKLPGGTRNKTGWATGVEVLQPLAREYPICAKILEYREVTKLKNTYIDVLPDLVGADGRLRTVFHQTSTATGRVSSSNPNLQNIPVRGDLGRRIRRAFVASAPSRMLLSADYDQIELRIVAHLSGDEAMRSAFTRGEDIHDVTARGIFHLDADAAVNAEQRRMAKSVNFGLLYGMSDFGLAQRLGIARGEARAMIEAYFARFPSVRAYIERVLAFGREHGYVETVLGRRRYFPDLQSRHHALRSAAEREATNAPMQGSAADVVKLAMVRLDRALRAERVDAVPLLQIHDELILETEHANLDRVARLVKREMEGALELSVPLAVTVKAGTNWQELREIALDA